MLVYLQCTQQAESTQTMILCFGLGNVESFKQITNTNFAPNMEMTFLKYMTFKI